ncbi:aminoglycoside phosphotransferase [Roseovarius faecimaris]|uniref:Aminoglycoside phosphotransferase n=1 Tax=Roseovarius faecimaris TaxID=2494550 RepID=A0A6I6IW55_9RHOB|nr:phosphotransferase [Roseovarius faecimaris]QGY00164.1 aminoglycoside phosphotransferase [Roseovarius faecimaris]
MPDRDAAIAAFVEDAGWSDATLAPLAGDASNRRYLRLTRDAPPGRAVLMDAPSDKGEDVRPFIAIATYLARAGFSAPVIYAADEGQGFLLLEDLGDDLFARVIPSEPELENSLYSCATDVLVRLHDTPPPDGLATYSISVMTEMAALSYDWYRTASLGPDDAARARFARAMGACLTAQAPEQDVLIQRDYHSENLLWLSGREGVARVGLLDFQDAMLGHRAYDLVSLLQDARRDVPPEIERAMIARYCTATGQDKDRFDAAYHALGAQRNLRILGVFARLCLRDGKAHYVDLIPRVWGLLLRDLAHPALEELRRIVLSDLPPPGADLCKDLKDKCATLRVQ